MCCYIIDIYYLEATLRSKSNISSKINTLSLLLFLAILDYLEDVKKIEEARRECRVKRASICILIWDSAFA